MTLPDERYRTVLATEQFLIQLCSAKLSPRVPRAIRQQARSLLKHYPTTWDMTRAAEDCPQVFRSKIEDLHRFVLAGSVDNSEKS